MLNPRVLTSLAFASALAALLSGCATARRGNQDLIGYSQLAADRLAASLEQPVIPGEGGVLVASMVNVDDMTESSAFGRIVSDQIASALGSAPHLLPIIEVRLRESIFLKERRGEFLLSREAQDVSKRHSAQAVLVGTYAVGHECVYVSARMVNPTTNQVVASYDYSVPLDDNTRTLLGYKRIHRPGWWSRLWGGKDVWSSSQGDYYKYYPDYL